MGGEKKPLVMSELGCADGCGQQMGGEIARTAADSVGAREWLEMGGEKKPMEIGELRGRLRTVWVPGSGWKWVGRRSRWRSASLDRKWVRRIARTAGAENCADGCGRRRCNGLAGNGSGRRSRW